MRRQFLKLTGFVLYGVFLFTPFVVQADDSFDIVLPFESSIAEQRQADVLFSVGGFDVRLDEEDVFTMPASDQWSLNFNAGEDTVLSNDVSSKIRHDRTVLDNGERKSFRFGVGLNYKF